MKRAKSFFARVWPGKRQELESEVFKSRHAYYRGLLNSKNYPEANAALRADNSLTNAEKIQIKSELSASVLLEQKLEWGNHGIRKTFRFWTDEQKIEYIRRANELLAAVQELTPLSCYGFGSVLGFTRDNGFIPHDDDLDLLVALPGASSNFTTAKQTLREHLGPKGFKLQGDYLSHFNVFQGEGRCIDLFIGFLEANTVSWFPSARGQLAFEDVFPTSTTTILGEECIIPARPERYLSVTYGDDWRNPIANWNHPWNAREYDDFR